MDTAELIAAAHNFKKISVIAGVGHWVKRAMVVLYG
jgi:histone acetyltransferase (RNA polymerase elongator complex component)